VTQSAGVRGLADAYGRGAGPYAAVLDPTLEQLATDMTDIAGIRAGQRVLDLASGTGAIARAAAATSARVVAVDLSPGMIAVARELSDLGFAFAVADAAALPLRTRTFDVVTCGLSMSHFTAMPAVLTEVRRILRSNGVFVASSWGRSGRDPAYAAVMIVYRRYTGNLPRPFSTLLDEASWSEPDRGRGIIAKSGFASVEVITRTVTGEYSTPDAATEWALAWPLTAEGLRRLTVAEREALRRDALTAVESAGGLRWERAVHYYRAAADIAQAR
jgi:ubiquinone/menaquinone biosynthesis C-methylase UbiE